MVANGKWEREKYIHVPKLLYSKIFLVGSRRYKSKFKNYGQNLGLTENLIEN